MSAELGRFSAETLPELERLLGELSVLSTSLRRVSDLTERQPGCVGTSNRVIAL